MKECSVTLCDGGIFECQKEALEAERNAARADAAKEREADLAAIQEGIAALDRMVSGFRKGIATVPGSYADDQASQALARLKERFGG